MVGPASNSVQPRILAFSHPRELDVLRQPGFVRGRAVLLLRFPGVDPETLQRWQRALNARFNACGCATGAALSIAGLLTCVIAQAWLGGWGVSHWGGFALRTVVGVLLGAALGKAIGIQAARWDLRRVTHSIQKSAGVTETGGL